MEMTTFFPSPTAFRPLRRALGLGLLAAAFGCDQNMSDTPLPAASAEDVSQVADRLSRAPSLSVPAGQTIAGLIELAPRVASLTAPSDVVFVIARDPESKGPPLAVGRLTGNAYPMRFVLDASTAMLPGASLARPVQLIVKVDKDGDANTSAAGDLIGFTGELVEPGDSDVRVALEGTLGELARAAEEEGAKPSSEGVDESPAEVPGEPPGGPGKRGARVAGTIAIAPGLAARTAPDDVVFVIAREPGAGGPPVAVARLRGNQYPMAFHLDDSSLMLRGIWPTVLDLEVRVDKDGDPMTRGPADLIGRAAGPVRLGESDVRIRLEG
jgi:hypothetical protein